MTRLDRAARALDPGPRDGSEEGAAVAYATASELRAMLLSARADIVRISVRRDVAEVQVAALREAAECALSSLPHNTSPPVARLRALLADPSPAVARLLAAVEVAEAMVRWDRTDPQAPNEEIRAARDAWRNGVRRYEALDRATKEGS